MARKPSNHTGLKIVLMVLMAVFIAASGFLIRLSLNIVDQTPTFQLAEGSVALPQPEATSALPATEAPTEPTMPEPEKVIATATISAQGDLLMHKPIFETNSVVWQKDGTYDFSPVFKYLLETTQSYDYAIANLETTFGGDDFPYQGNPAFNCPDSFLDSVVAAGYDGLLTANNHSYDTLMTGITRTLEKVRGAGLDTFGTRLTEEENRYKVVEVNGIKIGMVCYTYTSGISGDGRPRLNGNSPVEQPNLVNWFEIKKPQKMYDEMKDILAAMEAEGAEVTMLFTHWGNEYELTENSYQNGYAQALCDLGVDVIVGGHPHVVQPVELLTSTTDPEHKTICVYSMGNAVSNQRSGNIPACPTPHTEDGILFEITFEKYSDGKVYIQSADILPTWVNMHNQNGGREYNILPLDSDSKDQWKELFDLTDATLSAAQRSFDRTMKIVGEGLTQIQEFLTQEKQAREAYYLDLAANPETYAEAQASAPEAP